MTRLLRIAVLECDTPIDPVKERYGTYGDFFERLLKAGLTQLGRSDVELEVSKWDVVNSSVYPKPEEFDAVLLTGSKHDAWADNQWILDLTSYVAGIYKRHSHPIIGICFGHQIVARALGARVGRSDAGWEIAVEPVVLNDDGKKLFHRDTLALHQMHRDIAHEIPEGCVNLGSSSICKIQGLYQPKRIFTVQGHPEFDDFVVTKVVEARAAAGVFDPELARDGLSRAGNPHDGVLTAEEICRVILEQM